MLQMIVYYLLGGLIAFGLLFIYYKYKLKPNNVTKKISSQSA